jgi:1,2-diacylglycerol 3-beta-glucosyltransferase
MSLLLVCQTLCIVLSTVCLPATLYLGLLTVVSVRPRRPRHDTESHFVIVVPAHNEAAQIATTVGSLRALAYPKAHFEVWVVADNCTDATATRATAAGAKVLERHNAALRGKGYALEFAFEQVLLAKGVDAVVVVDADTQVSANLLAAFSARLRDGALAVQGHYGVSNPNASWRTRLMAVALAMFHRLRSLGRERLGVSAGLRGNGMCFSCALLRAHPHRAFGLVEDVEYGIAIGRAGVRIHYADEAHVFGEMVSNAQGSQTQRQRWEGGRMALVRQTLPGLLREAFRKKDPMLLDLAMDLAVPPLSYIGLGTACCALLAGGVWLGDGRLSYAGVLALSLAGLNLAALLAYVGRGAVLSNLGFGAVLALLWAPVYVLWKIVLMLRPKPRGGEWVRTRRESEDDPS